MKRVPKTRTIYDNYDPWGTYSDECIKEMALECEWVDDIKEITDSMIEQWRYEEMETDWENEKEMLTKFFEGKTVGFFGSVGRWNGTRKGGYIGEFWDSFYEAMRDCDYFRIYDENGHLYLTCSHYDGTNHFEIKIVGDKGRQYVENWEYSLFDSREPSYVYGKVFEKYSTLPRFAQKVYGCKAREYEEFTKGKIIDILNNEAKSNYC